MTAQLPPPAALGTPFQQVLRLYHIVTPVFEQYVGVSVARWRLLTQLYRNGPLNQSELQQRVQIDPAAITRQVKQLEEEGLVARRASPSDNRFMVVTLTAQGLALAETVHQRRDAFDDLIMRGLSADEVAVFEHCIAHIRAQAGAVAAQAEASSAEH